MKALLLPVVVLVLLANSLCAFEARGLVLCIDAGESPHVGVEVGPCSRHAPCPSPGRTGAGGNGAADDPCGACLDLPLSAPGPRVRPPTAGPSPVAGPFAATHVRPLPLDAAPRRSPTRRPVTAVTAEALPLSLRI